MNAIHVTPNRTAKGELGEVIEPLASYICAAEQPRKALLSVSDGAGRRSGRDEPSLRWRIFCICGRTRWDWRPKGIGKPSP